MQATKSAGTHSHLKTVQTKIETTFILYKLNTKNITDVVRPSVCPPAFAAYFSFCIITIVCSAGHAERCSLGKNNSAIFIFSHSKIQFSSLFSVVGSHHIHMHTISFQGCVGSSRIRQKNARQVLASTPWPLSVFFCPCSQPCRRSLSHTTRRT